MTTTIQQNELMEFKHNKVASRSNWNCSKITKKLVPVATFLEGSQLNFAAIIYANRTPAEKTAKIGGVLFEEIGLEGLDRSDFNYNFKTRRHNLVLTTNSYN